MPLTYSIISPAPSEEIITVLVDGELRSAANDHPNYERIKQAALDRDDNVLSLFDVAEEIATKFTKLSGRISAANGRLFIDGDEVNNGLSKQIIRFMDEGEDFGPLVAFFENVLANPQEHSREQLYAWLEAHDFTISPIGHIVAYKGVRRSAEGYESITTGPAIVNGLVVNGAVPNDLGNVIEMARSQVAHDPSQGCSTGLHVGTYSYASGFGPAVLEVHVNPRDIVSVPTDCNSQKVRCCRYIVAQEVNREIATALGGLGTESDNRVELDSAGLQVGDRIVDFDGDEGEITALPLGDRDYYTYNTYKLDDYPYGVYYAAEEDLERI